ncbi:hypothetical protein [Candidatus Clostridium stratigraminis]
MAGSVKLKKLINETLPVNLSKSLAPAIRLKTMFIGNPFEPFIHN